MARSSVMVRVGALLRPRFRAELATLRDRGITWEEHRGLLESYFVVRGSERALVEEFVRPLKRAGW